MKAKRITVYHSDDFTGYCCADSIDYGNQYLFYDKGYIRSRVDILR